ncbi:hypothetical protein RAS1_11070 [Phycisphaerae bacterium RAS1]|nr:hypothetical protein RAS1_11070 [Phycisphaerae bacterium RAS1]
MVGVCRAVHVCYGDPSLQEVVQSWLAAHQIETLSFEDAYGLTAHLILHSSQLADLALIGSDWIPADEKAVAEYVLETWPGVVLVVYGQRCEQLGPPQDPRVVRFASREMLERVTAQSPADFVASVRARGTPAAPASPAVAVPGETSPAAAAPSATSADASGRPVLTPEELSALLDEPGN